LFIGLSYNIYNISQTQKRKYLQLVIVQ